MDAPQRSTTDGEILAESRDQPPIYNPRSSHYAVAREGFLFETEMMAIVLGVESPFLEGAGLVQFTEPIARGHDSLFPTRFQFIFAPSGTRRGTAFL